METGPSTEAMFGLHADDLGAPLPQRQLAPGRNTNSPPDPDPISSGGSPAGPDQSAVNRLPMYYKASVTCLAPPDANGIAYPTSDTAARRNGFDASRGTLNLQTAYRPEGSFNPSSQSSSVTQHCTSGGNCPGVGAPAGVAKEAYWWTYANNFSSNCRGWDSSRSNVNARIMLFDATRRADMWSWLERLQGAGSPYADDPTASTGLQYTSCRASYSVVMTDGVWSRLMESPSRWKPGRPTRRCPCRWAAPSARTRSSRGARPAASCSCCRPH